MADERSKSIELAVSTIEKQFGKGSIMRLGLPRCQMLRPRWRSILSVCWTSFR